MEEFLGRDKKEKRGAKDGCDEGGVQFRTCNEHEKKENNKVGVVKTGHIGRKKKGEMLWRLCPTRVHPG